MHQSHGRLFGVFGFAFAIIISGFAALLASAQGTPVTDLVSPASDATFAAEPCPFPVPGPLVEGESPECGFVTTPQVHAEPDGEQIRLFLIRLISPLSDKLDTPLVYLAGGWVRAAPAN